MKVKIQLLQHCIILAQLFSRYYFLKKGLFNSHFWVTSTTKCGSEKDSTRLALKFYSLTKITVFNSHLSKVFRWKDIAHQNFHWYREFSLANGTKNINLKIEGKTERWKYNLFQRLSQLDMAPIVTVFTAIRTVTFNIFLLTLWSQKYQHRLRIYNSSL